MAMSKKITSGLNSSAIFCASTPPNDVRAAFGGVEAQKIALEFKPDVISFHGLIAVHLGHGDVQKNNIWLELQRNFLRLHATQCRANVISQDRHKFAERARQVFVVIHNK